MSKEVPLVMYDPTGNRQIVGVCKVEGETLTGTLSSEFAKALGLSDNRGFSISPEPLRAVIMDQPSQYGKINYLTPEQLEEIDRNARGYGFEIGKGRSLVNRLDELSPENPFLDPNWRDNIKE